MVNTTTAFWRGRSVLVTGHTGFKGSWLSLWLHEMGAAVHGFALEPPTHPNLFIEAAVRAALASDTRCDVSDLGGLRDSFAAAEPQVVFHLAAQPLVRESYNKPLETLATNVMGTAHVLEACRSSASVRAVIVVTTDKVYRDRAWPYPYREIDALGGHDLYSASKAAAEVVTAGYRASFFGSSDARITRIATARAGNVIGGGDWALDRLVPDCLRAFEMREPVNLRYPAAVRPWQHVLEPLSGYLMLAQAMCADNGACLADAWNFGPDPNDYATVGEIAQMAAALWPKDAAVISTAATGEEPHETGFLTVDSSRARADLGWRPRWTVGEAVQRTVAWHCAWRSGADMGAVSREQIRAFAAVEAV